MRPAVCDRMGALAGIISTACGDARDFLVGRDLVEQDRCVWQQRLRKCPWISICDGSSHSKLLNRDRMINCLNFPAYSVGHGFPESIVLIDQKRIIH